MSSPDPSELVKSMLTGSSPGLPAQFAAAVRVLAKDYPQGVDDPGLVEKVLGPSEDGSPHPCLQHVVIWHTTDCRLPVARSAGFLAEVYAMGADPNRVEQGHTALDVLARGVDEHGSWAGDLRGIGQTLLDCGARHWAQHDPLRAKALFAAEGQYGLVDLLTAHEQSVALEQTTPSPSVSCRRRGI